MSSFRARPRNFLTSSSNDVSSLSRKFLAIMVVVKRRRFAFAQVGVVIVPFQAGDKTID